MIRVEYISESKDIIANRIYALKEMIEGKHKIFIITPSSFYRFYPKKEDFLDSFIKLKVDEEVDFERLKTKLVNLGYYKVSKIDQSLQFASRGDIIDIYSINYEYPIRIEFFDNVIESIRYFDISNQLSFDSLKEVEILPATSLIFNEKEISLIKEKMEKRKEEDLTHLDPSNRDYFLKQIEEDTLDLVNFNHSSRLYKYYGYLKEETSSLLDYISNYSLIYLEKDEFLETKENLYYESHDLLSDLFENGKSLSRLELFNNSLSITNKNSKKNYYISFLDLATKNYKKIDISPILISSKKGLEYQKIIDFYLTDYKTIIFNVKNKGELQKVEDYLKFLNKDYKIIDSINDELTKDLSILVSDLSLSIEDKKDSFTLISSSILFNTKVPNFAYSSKFKEGVILGSYLDLEEGDYVVHEKYGIGQFIGIKELTLQNKTGDYLEIKYANNDSLLLPLYSFNLIRKYAGKDGRTPKLSKLHSDQWNKTKERIKNKVNDLADKLLNLYKNRSLIKGFAYPKDDELQEAFEREFSHELTKDQKRSLDEIKEDMESETPMDRLLCGDVGFGKTEIAFCAAFKAILAGKQVLMIAPTTLLAKQHYEVALSRFRKFDVRIALLTRNQSTQEVNRILKEVLSGKIHLVIGTHKALSKSLVFKDLGLLIIDEEQRFGVEQKEKIKISNQNIDVLTLSATPIPRTLQSSLIGLKSVSTIQSPPKERLPIQLYVIQKDTKVIKEIIERELARNGQIFYVHNNIFTIYELAHELEALIPDLRIGVVHGKMDKREIEDIMTHFYLGELDLLLATTIIENGIDVRNANLILVDNADRFGLAQLYQIKGRVGRGDRIAYCYLLVDQNKELNDDAKKRLKAIQDFTELGSGYKIAQRDLLIRGAGEILGPEQAGFIDDVGIDLYLKLLNEAIELKKTGIVKEEKKEKKTIKMHNSSYVPNNFANNEEKLELYQKINEADNFEKLDELNKYILDIYGNNIPQSFINLLKQRRIDIYLSFKEFENIEYPGKSVNIILSKDFSNIKSIGTDLFLALINYVNKIKITYTNKYITVIIKDENERNIDDLVLNILKIIHDEALKHEIR